jgi:uncharacterized protein YjeT (DUF2065 family)
MGISIFLAKLIGLYFLILGVLLLFRKRQIEAACKEVSSSKGILSVSAEISLLFGLVIAIDHTVWEASWRGLITLLGYIMILKGIMRFAFPDKVKKMFSKTMGNGYWLMVIIVLVIGIYLTYCGFTAGQQVY